MGTFVDLTGKKFGRLSVIKRKGSNLPVKWVCKCECGKTTVVDASHLKDGHTRSCGCLMKEIVSKTHSTHGMSKSPEYSVWNSMKDRCYNANNIEFDSYGGRGVEVCDRWRYSFENFYNDMGNKPRRKSLDRIDSNGDYSPDNCKWSNYIEQNNNKRNNILVSNNGITLTLGQWAREKGINYGTLKWRYYQGLRGEEPLAPLRRTYKCQQ